MNSVLKRLIVFFLSAGIFAIVAYIFYRESKVIRPQEMRAAIRATPNSDVLWALIFAALSYLLLTIYDKLGFMYIGKNFPYKRAALASFISYVFSHNIGFSSVISVATRQRIYGSWKVATTDILKIFAFCGYTFWLGAFGLGSIVFFMHPIVVPRYLRFAFPSTSILAWVSLAIVVVHLACVLVFPGRKMRGLRRFPKLSFPAIPSRFVGVTQLVLSTIDGLLTTGIIYFLMPHHASQSFSYYCEIFILAEVSAALSHIPGGLGIFETAFLVLLPSSLNRSQIMGALLLFRMIYHFLPFVLGTLVFALLEGVVLLRRIRSQRE